MFGRPRGHPVTIAGRDTASYSAIPLASDMAGQAPNESVYSDSLIRVGVAERTPAGCPFTTCSVATHGQRRFSLRPQCVRSSFTSRPNSPTASTL